VEKRKGGRTSGVLPEIRSGGTSREAGVTFVGLVLSLVNNILRMGEKYIEKIKGGEERIMEREKRTRLRG
jgi:hypothetical protein